MIKQLWAPDLEELRRVRWKGQMRVEWQQELEVANGQNPNELSRPGERHSSNFWAKVLATVVVF